MNSTTLWYVEFCINNLGVWDKKWFGTEDEAKAEYARLIEEEDCDPDSDDGEWGSILEPQAEEVVLTPEGVLSFANSFAIDTGNC